MLFFHRTFRRRLSLQCRWHSFSSHEVICFPFIMRAVEEWNIPGVSVFPDGCNPDVLELFVNRLVLAVICFRTTWRLCAVTLD